MISLKFTTPKGREIYYGNFMDLDKAIDTAWEFKHRTDAAIEVSHKPTMAEAVLLGVPYPTEIIYQP